MKFVDVFTFLRMGDLDADTALTALLQNQFFPNVKAVGEELPDLFVSKSFSEACARELATLNRSHHSASWIELRARRFDGLVRRLGVPHPVPYARLALHISAHWSDVASLLASTHSQIKPRFHEDGRMVQMDYETSESSLSRETRLAQGRRFLVKADVSNCFPSIYSHAIDWAARGKNIAKADRSGKSWQGKLDTLVRNCHDGETKGVMIGPAVSNLLAEIVLQRVDAELAAAGYDFIRYVDDYTSYCIDRSEAEQFVVKLQRELATYRLDLNTRKTRIADLSDHVGDPWMAEVRAHLPAKPTDLTAARFLQQAEILAARYPLFSVLKLAVKTLRGSRAKGEPSSILVVDELLRLCTFHPHLAPFLAGELATIAAGLTKFERERMAKVIEPQMIEAAMRAETDTVLWYLHILRRVLRLQVRRASWGPLLEMNDDMVALAVAILCCRARRAVVARVRGRSYVCDQDYEQHWLSRYELYRVGLLSEPDMSPKEKEWMAVMHKHGVVVSALTK